MMLNKSKVSFLVFTSLFALSSHAADAPAAAPASIPLPGESGGIKVVAVDDDGIIEDFLDLSGEATFCVEDGGMIPTGDSAECQVVKFGNGNIATFPIGTETFGLTELNITEIHFDWGIGSEETKNQQESLIIKPVNPGTSICKVSPATRLEFILEGHEAKQGIPFVQVLVDLEREGFTRHTLGSIICENGEEFLAGSRIPTDN